MKKYFLGLAMLALVSLVSASAFTSPTAFPTQNMNISDRANDSIIGIDSITLVKNQTIDGTANYAIRTSDSIATGDSVYLMVRVFDSKGVLVNAFVGDTLIQGTTYKTSNLPINETVFGYNFTIKAKGAVAVLRRRLYSTTLIKNYPIEGFKVPFTR